MVYNLIIVATDSFSLAEKKIKVRGAEAMSVLIPFKNIPEILRVFGELQGEVKICFNKNQVSFSNIFLKESKTEAVVLKQELLGALKLSNIFSDKFNQVNLRIAPKEKIFESLS